MAQLAIIKQMCLQVSRGSDGHYHADEQAGVEQLCWRLSGRRTGRCRAAQLATIKQMSRQVSRGSAGDNKADEQAGVEELPGNYQAEEQAGVAQLSWRLSSRLSGRCRAAQLEIIKQMSRQVSRSSAGDYQTDEQACVARLSWRL